MDRDKSKLHKVSFITIVLTILSIFYMLMNAGNYRKIMAKSERFEIFKIELMNMFPEIKSMNYKTRTGRGPSGIDFEYFVEKNISDESLDMIFLKTKMLVSEVEFQDSLVLPNSIDPKWTSQSYFPSKANIYISFTYKGESVPFMGYVTSYDYGVEYNVAVENILHTRYNIWRPAMEYELWSSK